MERYVRTIPSRDVIHQCKYCKSRSLKKRSVRKNKSGDVQLLKCKDCGRTFSTNVGFRYRRYGPEIITEALRLSFSKMSTREISVNFAARGIKVRHTTNQSWIRRYSEITHICMNTAKPDVGNKWRADEVYVNADSKKKYLFASMDDETRLWMALDLAEKKTGHDASKLFEDTMKLADRYPKQMITDGLGSYKQASRDVFKDMVDHVSEIHITGLKKCKDNNKMERLNGTIRDREQNYRGVSGGTSVFKGLQTHYNHVRPHGALRGKTPGEAAGINIKGEDKWMTIIQNASLYLSETKQRV